jgi:hypothetical protein
VLGGPPALGTGTSILCLPSSWRGLLKGVVTGTGDKKRLLEEHLLLVVNFEEKEVGAV